jgi:hypothetical protein
MSVISCRAQNPPCEHLSDLSQPPGARVRLGRHVIVFAAVLPLPWAILGMRRGQRRPVASKRLFVSAPDARANWRPGCDGCIHQVPIVGLSQDRVCAASSERLAR